jgi:hypothetical protein
VTCSTEPTARQQRHMVSVDHETYMRLLRLRHNPIAACVIPGWPQTRDPQSMAEAIRLLVDYAQADCDDVEEEQVHPRHRLPLKEKVKRGK